MSCNQNDQVITGKIDGTPINLLRHDVAKKLNNNVVDDNESNYSVGSIQTTTDIKNLVNEINNDIKKKSTNKKNKTKKKYEKPKNTPDIYEDSIYEDSMYDGILLLIIYLLMSQEFVRNFVGRYIRTINNNAEGVVPFKGVVVYGIIFVLIFLSIRLAIYKISQ